MLNHYTAGQTLGIVRHKAERMQRSDLAWNWILFLIQSLHWLAPLVWPAGRQLRNEREILCDDAALSCESLKSGVNADRPSSGPSSLTDFPLHKRRASLLFPERTK